MAAAKKTEIAVVSEETAIVPAARVSLPQVQRNPHDEYMAMQIAMGAGDAGEIEEAIRDNLGGKPLSTFDFMRIKVPGSAGLSWEVPNLETGELESEKVITGIIVAFQDKKSYWKDSLSEPGAKMGPPDCFSEDAIQGIGNPGVPCATCKFNQFGTAKNGKGKGKACKDWQALWVAREGDILPILIGIPPKSLKSFKMYKNSLITRGVSYYKAITEFTLSKDKNDDGIPYSKVEFRMASAVDAQHAPFIKKYSDLVKSLMSKVPIAAKAAVDAVAADEAVAPAGDGNHDDVGEVTAGNPFEDRDRSQDV